MASPATDTAPPARRAFGIAGLLAAAAFVVLAGPWLFDAYLQNILVKAFFFAIVAVTVDVLWGYTGYLTFGQSAFFGVGAYAAGLVFTHQGFSAGTVALALGLSIVLPALLALFVGWLSFYRGASPFFATVISLVVPIVASQLLLSGGTWTGSSSGLTGFTSFDWELHTWYWVAGLVIVVLVRPRPAAVAVTVRSGASGLWLRPKRSTNSFGWKCRPTSSIPRATGRRAGPRSRRRAPPRRGRRPGRRTPPAGGAAGGCGCRRTPRRRPRRRSPPRRRPRR